MSQAPALGESPIAPASSLPSYLQADNLGPWGNYLQQVDRVIPRLGSLARFYGPQAGNQNFARFQNDEFDRIYERMQQIADGPERDTLFLEAKRIAVAYMPYKFSVHPIANDIVHPQLIGYRRPLFWLDWYHRVDIDDSLRVTR